MWKEDNPNLNPTTTPTFQVMLGAVDCTGASNKDVCGKYGVKGYPTLIYLSYGAIPHKYSGGRDQAAFVKVSRKFRARYIFSMLHFLHLHVTFSPTPCYIFSIFVLHNMLHFLHLRAKEIV